jgi:hypothetical protein
MGALWGALGGAADAAKEVYGKKQDAEISEAKSEADLQRDMRLEKMRQKYKTGQAGVERTYQTEERVAGQEFETAERLGKQEHTSGEDETGRQFDAVQEDKKFDSAENVARIAAESRENVAKSSGKAGSSKDYKSVKIKLSTMTKDGFEEKEVPIVFQESTGQYWEDQAGQLVPYNLESHLSGNELTLFKNPSQKNLALWMNSPRGKKYGAPKWYEAKYGKVGKQSAK